MKTKKKKSSKIKEKNMHHFATRLMIVSSSVERFSVSIRTVKP